MQNNKIKIVPVLIVLVPLFAAALWFGGVDDTAVGRAIKARVTRIVRGVSSRLGMPADIMKKKKKSAKTKASSSRHKRTTASSSATTCSLSGVVTDDAGKPIKEAKVLVSGTDNPSFRKTVTTDKAGRYAFATLPPATYDVAATHEKYVGMIRRSFVLRPSDSKVEIRFALPFSTSVKGKVLDEEGKPVASARVAAHRQQQEVMIDGDSYVNDAGYLTVDSAPDGAFKMSGIGAGETMFECSRPGYSADAQVLKFASGETPKDVKIVLKKTGVISGFVVDENNNPVSSATVCLTSYKPYGDTTQTLNRDKYTTQTGANGSFAFKKLFDEGFYDIAYEHPDYAPGTAPFVSAGSENVVCVIERGGTIRGSALFIDRPTTAASVLLGVVGDIKGTTFSRQVRSDADGKYEIPRLPYGTYSLFSPDASLGMEPRAGLALSRAKSVQVVNAELFQACVLRGQVVDAETEVAIPNATIRVDSSYGPSQARRRSFKTAASETGDFELSKLPAGFHVAGGSARGYIQSTAGASAQTLTLMPGEKRTDIVLRLTRGAVVEGTVVMPDGKTGIPECDVQLFTASTSLGYNPGKNLAATTDATGHFRIGGIEVVDRIQLYASARKLGYAKTRSSIIDLSAAQPSVTIQIRMCVGGVVTGKITDTRGTPIAAAQVKFASREFVRDPTPSTFGCITGADGVYVLRCCSPGLARITVSHPRFVDQRKDLTVRDERTLEKVNFKLQEGYRTHGRVAGFDGKPIANAKVTAQPLQGATGTEIAMTNKDGEFTMNRLGKGVFRLEAVFTLHTDAGDQIYKFALPRAQSGTQSADIDCDIGNSATGIVDGERQKVDRFTIKLKSARDTTPKQEFQFDLTRRYTGAHGYFRLMSVPRGVYSLDVTADGYQPYHTDELIIGPGARTTVPTIKLRAAGGISGMLISSSTDRPINGATIRLLDNSKNEFLSVTREELRQYPSTDIVELVRPDLLSDYDDPADNLQIVAIVRVNAIATAKSDYTGKFSITSAPNGNFAVLIEHPRYVPLRLDNIEVFPKRPTDLGHIYLQPGGGIRGIITDQSGNPVPDLTVTVSGHKPKKTTRTDAAGNYLLQGVLPTRQNVVVQGTLNGRSIYVYAPADVTPDQDARLDFAIDMDCRIEGTMTAAPATAGTARIYVIDENGAVLTTPSYSATMRNGNYVITNLPPGNYLLVITGPFAFTQPIQIGHGTTQIALPTPTAGVRGQLLSASGAPIAGTVQLVPLSLQGIPPSILNALTRSANASRSGIYQINSLMAGAYQVLCRRSSAMPWAAVGVVQVSDGQRITGYQVRSPQ